MITLQAILGGAAAKATGWALIHVLWQASLIATILGVALYALRERSANTRYVAACIALAATIALPIATGIASFEALPGATPLMPVEAAATSGASTVGIDAVETQLKAPSLTERFSNLPVEPALPWVVAIWLAGVMILSMRIAYGLTSVSRMGRLGTSAVPQAVERTMHELADIMGLQRAVKIMRSKRIEVPTVIGWLEPVILVPASALSGLSPHQLRTILAHELAHVRRHDFAVNLVQTAVETLLFFHPAVWWISRQVRIEREHCCDDIAVALCGDPIDYARALATMEELRAGMLPALAASGGSLSGRIRRLLGIRNDESEAVRPAIAVAAALAVTMAAVLPIFAGSYIYQSVTDSSAPGTSIVVLGDSDEDLDTLVDEVIDAHLAAAEAGERVGRIREEHLARLEQIRAEVEQARSIAAQIDTRELAEAERALARAERSRAVEVARMASETVEAQAEAAALAELYSNFAFVIAPVAPVAPIAPLPPTPSVAPVAPVVPAFPAPPVPPLPPFAPAIVAALSDLDELPVILGSSHFRTRDEKPLDIDNPTAGDLIFLKSYGIDAKYIREMQSAGLTNLTARELAILRSYGVDAATVKELRSSFGNDLPAATIGAMASLGIDAAWVREMRSTGMKLTPSDAIRMKSLGIDASTIHSMEGVIGKGVTPRDAARLRSMGVDSDYVSSIRKAGYADVSTPELMRLKSLGIDADWINAMNGTRGEKFSVRDLLRLKSAGVDAEYLENWK